jgi:hypothetical protein
VSVLAANIEHMIESLAIGDHRDVVLVREALAQMTPAADEGEALDRIRALEELKAACAAAQVWETAAFDHHRRENEAARGVAESRRGQGVANEIALARRESPARGSRHLGLASALVGEMPRTLAALTAGTLSEDKAIIMCRETAWLAARRRFRVDRLMGRRFAGLGVRQLAGEARAHAQRLDQASAVEQLERSEKERRVSVRPAPGNMAYLTALLPMPQAVAAYARLHKEAATAVGTGAANERSHGQVMADLLITRLTGQEEASGVPIELQLVMTDESLLSGGAIPAWIPGHGPIPAEAARRLIADTQAAVFLRRLFTAPESGQLVGMDSKRREFSGVLRQMVIVRDDMCRTPWCEAHIKHIDHATPHRSGGATSWDNASGLCARCNYIKENPGWQHEANPQRLNVTTPTGRTYTSITPPVARGAPPPKERRPEAEQASFPASVVEIEVAALLAA